MAKNVFLATILVFLIIADVSNATLFGQFRKLIAPSPNGSPNPSPVTSGNQSGTVGGEKEIENEKQSQNQPTPDSNAGKDKSKVAQATDNTGSAPTPTTDTKQDNNSPKEGIKGKDATKSDLPHQSKDSCSGYDFKCHDTKLMTACVENFDDVSKPLALLIQNKGDSNISVDLFFPTSANKQKPIEVPKLETITVNISYPNRGNNEIRLNAGNGDCVLRLGVQASQGNFFQHFPSYTKFMTPVYGAYFVFLIIITAGGVCACCWFGKRKAHSEIPYQELEMSRPESAAAAAAETSEGWDEVWDDDWDEEKAVTSPGARNMSTNGLASRSHPSKDGWEDWDE